jgi:hypothetical protein
MAETTTFPHRWVLPLELLIVLIASHNEWPLPSFQSGAEGYQLWRCPACGWIERKSPRQRPPRCYGPEGDEHAAKETILLEGRGYSVSVGRRRFR